MDRAARHLELFDREGTLALELGGDRVQFDPGSSAIHLIHGMLGGRVSAIEIPRSREIGSTQAART